MCVTVWGSVYLHPSLSKSSRPCAVWNNPARESLWRWNQSQFDSIQSHFLDNTLDVRCIFFCLGKFSRSSLLTESGRKERRARERGKKFLEGKTLSGSERERSLISRKWGTLLYGFILNAQVPYLQGYSAEMRLCHWVENNTCSIF